MASDRVRPQKSVTNTLKLLLTLLPATLISVAFSSLGGYPTTSEGVGILDVLFFCSCMYVYECFDASLPHAVMT